MVELSLEDLAQFRWLAFSVVLPPTLPFQQIPPGDVLVGLPSDDLIQFRWLACFFVLTPTLT